MFGVLWLATEAGCSARMVDCGVAGSLLCSLRYSFDSLSSLPVAIAYFIVAQTAFMSSFQLAWSLASFPLRKKERLPILVSVC